MSKRKFQDGEKVFWKMYNFRTKEYMFVESEIIDSYGTYYIVRANLTLDQHTNCTSGYETALGDIYEVDHRAIIKIIVDLDEDDNECI